MSINDLVLKVNDVLTGSVLIIALVGIGLLFTFKLGFIQIRGFKDGWSGSNLLDVDQRIPRNVNDLRRSGYGSEVQAGQ